MIGVLPRRPLIPHTRLPFHPFDAHFLTPQAIKFLDFIQYSFSSSNNASYYGRKWLLVDFAYCTVLSQLRIPRLNYKKAVVLLQIFTLWFLDGLMFGGLQMNMFRGNTEGTVSTSGFKSTFSICKS